MRSGGRVVMLCAVIGGCALAAPASAATRCAKGTTAVYRAGTRLVTTAPRAKARPLACVRVPRSAQSPDALVAKRFARQVGGLRGRQARSVAALRRHAALLARAARAVAQEGAGAKARHAAPRALGGQSGSFSEPLEGAPGGTTGTVTGSGTHSAADEVPGTLGDSTTTLEGKRDGVPASVYARAGLGTLAKRCPDAAGLVPARSHYAVGQGATVGSGEGRLTLGTDSAGDVDVTARVRDDARLATYDYKGAATIEIRTGAGKRIVTSTYRVLLGGAGVDPHAAPDLERIARDFFLSARVFGPKGRVPWQSRTSLDMIGIAYSLDVALREQVAKTLLAAERYWYDEYGCVRADVTPATQQSSTGGSVQMQALGRSKVDDAVIPEARLQASTYEPWTTLSAVSGTGTLELTASDAGGQWLAERTPVVDFTVLSRRGRGRGQGVITIPGRPPVPLMHVRATLKTEVPCDDARTSYATVDDATIDGDLTARSSSNERNSTGAGRATGTSGIVMGDCDHLESSQQDDAADFSAAYLSDGTVSVSWVAQGMFMRWSYLGWTATGNGTRTEDWTDDDGTRHHLTVTISDLRASTD